MEASAHSGGEEESELSMLIGTPQTTYPPGSQGLEDSQSSVEFDSLYQSGGLEGAGQFHLVFSLVFHRCHILYMINCPLVLRVRKPG